MLFPNSYVPSVCLKIGNLFALTRMSLSHSGGSKQVFVHFHRIFAELTPDSRRARAISRLQSNFFSSATFNTA